MSMIQIQDELIAKVLRNPKAIHMANAQRHAERLLMAKGYTASQAADITRQALDMASLERLHDCAR